MSYSIHVYEAFDADHPYLITNRYVLKRKREFLAAIFYNTVISLRYHLFLACISFNMNGGILLL